MGRVNESNPLCVGAKDQLIGEDDAIANVSVFVIVDLSEMIHRAAEY